MIDGFFYFNKVLEECGIMDKKGFFESYDCDCFVKFLIDLKVNKEDVEILFYLYFIYDVLDEICVIYNLDIVIIEGINVF